MFPKRTTKVSVAMGRAPGQRKSQVPKATFQDGTPKPNTKLQKRLDGLMVSVVKTGSAGTGVPAPCCPPCTL